MLSNNSNKSDKNHLFQRMIKKIQFGQKMMKIL